MGHLLEGRTTVLTREPRWPDSPEPRDLRQLSGYPLYRDLCAPCDPALVRVEAVCALPDSHLCSLFAMRAWLDADDAYPSAWCLSPDRTPLDEATIAGMIRDGLRGPEETAERNERIARVNSILGEGDSA